jgi:ATP-binding cassette subfamily A (ABC1) protein 3
LGVSGYASEGFLYLQYAVETSFTRLVLNEDDLKTYAGYDLRLQRYPYPPYLEDKYLFALQGWLPLLIMLSFIYPAINITKSVVYEKEKRLKVRQDYDL